jgi:hypothetical protein
MSMRHLAVLGLLVLAGCMSSGPNGTSFSSTSTQPVVPPCTDTYYDGCDNNPDAAYLLATYGLHQITNTSHALQPPKIDSGLVAWMAGGSGSPVDYHSFDVLRNGHFAFRSQLGWIPNIPYPADCCIFYSRMEDAEAGAGYKSSQAYVWNPTSAENRQIALPFDGAFVSGNGGFDGAWALLRLLNETSQDSMIAVNTDTGAWRWLFQGGARDNTYYGTPQVGQTISNGSAFLTYLLYEGTTFVGSRIVEYDLEEGTESIIFERSDIALTWLDASPRYLVATRADGSRNLWVMDRMNGTWWNLARPDSSDHLSPAVGGDWVVYLDGGASPDNHEAALVGIHISTGQRLKLLPHYNPSFSIIDWDTDGEHLAVKLFARESTTNLQFPGTQIYWMELPSV